MWGVNWEAEYERTIALNQWIIRGDFDEQKSKMTLDEFVGVVDKENRRILTWLTMERVKTDAMVAICEENPLYKPHLNSHLRKQKRIERRINKLRELWEQILNPPPEPTPEIREEPPRTQAWALECRRLLKKLRQTEDKSKRKKILEKIARAYRQRKEAE